MRIATFAPSGLARQAAQTGGPKLTKGIEIGVASQAIALPEGEPKEWVQLLPAGTFMLRDGRGPMSVDAAAVAAETQSAMGGEPLPIDYAHVTHYSGPGAPAASPAAGWIHEIEAREDGVWGRVQWTPAGAQRIRDREYPYLSPEFWHAKKPDRKTKAQQIMRVIGASLVINPAMPIAAVASRQQPSQGTDMDEKQLTAAAAAITGALGLAEDADVEKVTARVKSLADGVAAIASALGREGETDTAKLVTAAKAAVAQAEPDPAKWVPMDQVKALQADVAALKTARADEVAETKVAAAIAAGKVIPAQKGWALKLCRQDVKAFDEFVDGAPVVVTPGAADTAKGKAPGPDSPLDATERSVCRQLGVNEEAFKKARAERLATEEEAA